MVRSMRWFHWAAIVTGYWLCSLWLLFNLCSISIDNFGATTGFNWGAWGSTSPTPALFDYDNSFAVRIQFFYSYWVGSLILTLSGCALTPWLLRLWNPRAHSFLLASMITLISLAVVGAISDLGVAYHMWRGPVIYYDFNHLRPFLTLIVLSSLCAGVLVLVRGRLWAS